MQPYHSWTGTSEPSVATAGAEAQDWSSPSVLSTTAVSNQQTSHGRGSITVELTERAIDRTTFEPGQARVIRESPKRRGTPSTGKRMDKTPSWSKAEQPVRPPAASEVRLARLATCRAQRRPRVHPLAGPKSLNQASCSPRSALPKRPRWQTRCEIVSCTRLRLRSHGSGVGRPSTFRDRRGQ